MLQHSREHEDILQGHGDALARMGLHRMRGIPEQLTPSPRPLPAQREPVDGKEGDGGCLLDGPSQEITPSALYLAEYI